MDDNTAIVLIFTLFILWMVYLIHQSGPPKK